MEYWTAGNGTLRFYTDQPFEYLDIDCSHYENRFRENAYAEKFRIVKILQPITAAEQERLRALQFAGSFMNTATVSIALIEQKEVSIFQHSLGIYDNQMVICSYGLYGSRYTSSCVHMDESFVHELTNDFDIHFDSAQIALQPNIRFTLQDMYHALSNFYDDRETLYYTGMQLFLPFLPPQLLSLCTQCFEDLPFLQKKARKQGEIFRDFLKNHKVLLLFRCSLLRTAGTPIPRLISSPKKTAELHFHKSNTFFGNYFVPYQSNRPIFIQPLHKIQSVFLQEHLKKRNRAQTQQLLTDTICSFGGIW